MTNGQAGLASLTPAELRRAIDVIPSAFVLVDSGTHSPIVINDAARSLGVVRDLRIVPPQIAAMIDDVERGASARTEEVEVRLTPFASGRVELQTRVVRVDESMVVVFAEDMTSARRVDRVRRDFVANVSHELKTPVGAMSILAEAILAAADSPAEVRHFAGRMQTESARLAHLVGDLVDLSRLQGDDPMQYAESIELDAILREAVDSMGTAAQAQSISIVVGGDPGLRVFGVESQLVTAVRNLLSNAVAYSPAQTKVAVGRRTADNMVEITVTDQGIGIPAEEVDRIFERFYRVDQARSRQTGGTGLGLSIVKHVCQNHGGNVSVWSAEGEGSTFTLRLPKPSHRDSEQEEASVVAAATYRGVSALPEHR